MIKKVLAIYYSQSGQLDEIIGSVTGPLLESGATVEKIRIKPVDDYAFPWTGKGFYAVMPDCVLGTVQPLVPFAFREDSYDLIVLGYQAWFLFPSIPCRSLLQDPGFRAIVKNTPVITVTGARNMWVNAFEEVKASLSAAGAKLVGNIALVDTHPNVVSFVTIFHWLLGGKKDRYLNLFPPPGVAAGDIVRARVFGSIVLSHLNKGNWEGMQEELVREKAVGTKYVLQLLESKAVPTYYAWTRFILKRKKRAAWLVVFKYYLLFALFVGAPILIVADALFVRPFSSGRARSKKQYYSALN